MHAFHHRGWDGSKYPPAAVMIEGEVEKFKPSLGRFLKNTLELTLSALNGIRFN
jgi:hypothetical protein